MKFLTELPDEEFLRHCWQIADVAEEVLEKSKIMELRKRAESALGAKFDLRRFHTVVLANGALPLNVLEAEVDRWIAEQRGA